MTDELLQAENARLRKALVEIYRRADIQADEPIVEICEAALSTPADEPTFTGTDAEAMVAMHRPPWLEETNDA